MARIINIKPPCGYVPEGVASIQLLDWEDFKGYGFANDDLYGNCLVTGVSRVAEFTDMPAVNAKYSTTQNGKLKLHTLETFVSDLSALTLSNLNLAEKRRYIVVFRMNNDRYYTFGYEAGATVGYVNQSEDGIGAMVTISALSTYPLFEVDAAAFVNSYAVGFTPDFDNGAFCEIF